MRTAFVGNAGIGYEILPKLTAQANIGINRFDLNETRFSPSFTSQGGGTNGQNVRSGTFFQNAILRGTLNYRNLFNGVHNVSGLVGFTWEDSDQNEITATGTQFATDDVYALSIAAVTTATGSSTESGLRRAVASGEYSYDNKYLATFSLSVDQSSRFGEENQTGVFPAFSLGWNAQQEGFLQNVSWIDLFKIRGSYGLTGNDDIGNFAARALYGGGQDYANTPGFGPASLGNAFLSWEETEQASLGLDFGFFTGRLGGSVEIYQKDTNQGIFNQPFPSSSGYFGRVGNVTELRNRGIEFQLDTRNIDTRNFSWNTTINLGSNDNQVVKLVDGDFDGEGDPIDSGFASRIAEGEPLGAFYGWRWDGVFQSEDELCKSQTGETSAARNTRCAAAGLAFQSGNSSLGDFRFKDINNDGIINGDDREILGHANPDLFGGITNDFTLYGFNVSAFLQFSLGNETFNASRQFYQGPGQTFGTSAASLNRWTPENTNTDIPRATNSDPNDNDRDSDYFMEDGSYLRLRTLTVSYNVPSRFLNQISMRGLRVFFVGENLWTTTNYSGLDPEVSTFDRSNTAFGTDFFTYPQSQRFTVGARVTL